MERSPVYQSERQCYCGIEDSVYCRDVEYSDGQRTQEFVCKSCYESWVETLAPDD